ncbi:alpha/beta hydrolase family protein [Timonella sp. A28]|uniref:alpha/beta hydrolase family protein n=1 Tax=Timonella sp. A28 TaxID=3442640 RepID=UPI003EBE405A
MNKKKVKRRVFIATAAACTLILAAVTVFIVGNDYRYAQTKIQIPSADGYLEGVYAKPAGAPAKGLVIMVHGDGPINATHNDFYAPWFEAAADAGFATVSWSKPGVAGSDGNWLNQSMDDRAQEVHDVLDWAHTQSEIPTEHIALWGASQAGWVMPQVVAQRTDIDGMIAVGTAVNWLDQGRYNLHAELDHAGATQIERDAAIAHSDRVRDLLKSSTGYDEYTAIEMDESHMSAERWEFARKNMMSDATEDLHAAAERDIPVFLMAAEHDRNVDIAETERVYRDAFGEKLTVTYFDAVHSMAKPRVEESAFIGAVTAIFWPRALFGEHVLDSYREFLEATN